ncbi:MAG: glycosyltransferase [Betaproteobacteria bacterium]|nr:glycosyltransferase [Betaproteobacteria bacterium]
MRIFDLHPNPTTCEGLNMVTLEAAAVGTPTVTGDGAGIADWVKRYGAGAVVPKTEVGALADAIIRALNDELSCWASNARPMADEFLLERVAPAMLELPATRTRGSGVR